MSDIPHQTDRISVRISSTGNRVRVIAEARDDVTFQGMAEVTHDNGCTTFAHVRSPLTIHVPTGSDVVIGSESARVQVTGAVGHTAVVTNSGRIDVEEAMSVDARTASGRVTVGRCHGACRAHSDSGRVQVDHCAAAEVATKSGRITLDNVNGPVHAHCVSGRIDVTLVRAHDVSAETVSGRINVALPPGATAYRPNQGDDATATPDQCDCTVNVRSVSGRVDVLTT